MLERLSTSHDGGLHKLSRTKSDRFHVFGGKKQASFHVVISELRAELLSTKQHAPGHPCVLMWVRGETVHVTEDSVGKTVLSWSDTYFAQVISLQPSGSGYRSKECKFKVQQKGKTIAKTGLLDLAKYCSDMGLAKEQPVSVPLQPSGTLYFMLSTAPVSEPPQQQQDPSMSRGSCKPDSRTSYSQNSVSGTATAAALATPSCAAAARSSVADGNHGAAASNYGGLAATAAASTPASGATAAAAAAAGKDSGREGDAASTADGADRPSSSARSTSTSLRKQLARASGKGDADGGGGGIFRRIARGSSKQPAAAAAAAAAAVLGPNGCSPNQNPLPFRKSDSAHVSSPTGGDVAALWDDQSNRSLSRCGSARPSGGGAVPYSPSHRATHSFTGSPGQQLCTSSPLQLQFPPMPLDPTRNIGRRSGGVSNSSSSDTVAASMAAASAGKATGGGAATGTDGGSGGPGGGGWGSWLRGGLGWGRSSNHSVAGTSTTGALSQASLAGPGGGAGGVAEAESSALEAAIISATEPSELRDLALDMLHERDEWRNRALTAQDAMGRAQASRGSAVREVQRLEVRLRQYQDELGRRADGSLLQELVESKVRLAELANENMKLRRQITHMGPLFYDDSGDDAQADGRG